MLPKNTMKLQERARRGISISLFLALAAGPTTSHADEASEGRSVDDRWIPSASLYSFGNADQRTARMSADTALKPGQPLLDLEDQSYAWLWSVGGTVDLATPVLLDLPGRPRFFVHADVGFSYDVEDPIVTSGDPGSPPIVPERGAETALNIDKVGAAVRAEGKSLVLSGGFGPQLSFEYLDRGFRVRPTLEWMYRVDTIKSLLGGAESEAATGTLCNPSCRTLFIKAQNEKGYHSIGPGFELEADVGRFGDFMVGWYGSVRAFYVVSDRKANIRTTGAWRRIDNQPTTRPDTAFVTRYEREPWHYRFGMGIRVSWLPEE